MPEYREGQRVRVEIEGVVEQTAGEAMRVVTKTDNWYLAPGADGVTVTVLAEPRPEEPTGLGAVVEALFHSPGTVGQARQVWVRRVDAQNQRWVSEDARWYATWDYLEDPVVLHEGWKP